MAVWLLFFLINHFSKILINKKSKTSRGKIANNGILLKKTILSESLLFGLSKEILIPKIYNIEPVHEISNNVVCAPAKPQISLRIRAV